MGAAMRTATTRAGARTTAGALVLLVATACGGSSGGGTSGVGSGSGSGPTVRHVTEADAGQTVTMHRGDRLVIELHSTYWSFQPVPPVLRQVSAPSVVAPSRCPVVGSGCGTVTVELTAVRTGMGVVAARRTSCGEAMRCTGATGTWSLRVEVT
jgi:hypothetical protein